MKLLALWFLLAASANALAAFDMEVSVDLPQGPIVPPETEALLDITVRNLGPDPATAQAVGTFYFQGALQSTIGIAPTPETPPCSVAITSLSPVPGRPIPYSANIIPPSIALAAGESITCRVALQTFFDSPDRIDQAFSMTVEPGDTNPDNNRVLRGIVIRPAPLFIPATDLRALLMMIAILLVLGCTHLLAKREGKSV